MRAYLVAALSKVIVRGFILSTNYNSLFGTCFVSGPKRATARVTSLQVNTWLKLLRNLREKGYIRTARKNSKYRLAWLGVRGRKVYQRVEWLHRFRNALYLLASLHNMAPRLPHAKLEMIRDMILSKSLTTSEMAKAAECSKRSIINISNNLRWFGNVKAPQTRVGRRRTVTPSMLEALCDHLLEKPGLYVDEMAIFLWDEFCVQVTNSSLKRALASVGWSKKVARQRAKEQNADLRDFYLHNLSDFQSHHLVYVDESGCDKRIGFRRTGWSPLGVTPLQIANFHRDQ